MIEILKGPAGALFGDIDPMHGFSDDQSRLVGRTLWRRSTKAWRGKSTSAWKSTTCKGAPLRAPLVGFRLVSSRLGRSFVRES